MNNAKAVYNSNIANVACLFWFNDYSLLESLFLAHTSPDPSSPHSSPLSYLTEAPKLSGSHHPAFSDAHVPSKLSISSVSFRQFVGTVLVQTQLPPTAVSLALLYIFRLKALAPQPIRGSANSEYRVLAVALILANKFLDDNTYTNKTWADITHLPLREITAMEVEFLANIRYKLNVSKAAWIRWQSDLKQWLVIHAKLVALRSLPTPPLQPSLIHTSPKRKYVPATESPTKRPHLDDRSPQRLVPALSRGPVKPSAQNQLQNPMQFAQAHAQSAPVQAQAHAQAQAQAHAQAQSLAHSQAQAQAHAQAQAQAQAAQAQAHAQAQAQAAQAQAHAQAQAQAQAHAHAAHQAHLQAHAQTQPQYAQPLPQHFQAPAAVTYSQPPAQRLLPPPVQRPGLPLHAVQPHPQPPLHAVQPQPLPAAPAPAPQHRLYATPSKEHHPVPGAYAPAYQPFATPLAGQTAQPPAGRAGYAGNGMAMIRPQFLPVLPSVIYSPSALEPSSHSTSPVDQYYALPPPLAGSHSPPLTFTTASPTRGDYPLKALVNPYDQQLFEGQPQQPHPLQYYMASTGRRRSPQQGPLPMLFSYELEQFPWASI